VIKHGPLINCRTILINARTSKSRMPRAASYPMHNIMSYSKGFHFNTNSLCLFYFMVCWIVVLLTAVFGFKS